MAEKQLIFLNDINEFWPLSQNIDQSKINANVMRAQQSDLSPILGSALYHAFIEDFDGSNFATQIYTDLFYGTDYVFKGNTIYFRGVRPLLSTFAYNRIVDTNKVNIVRNGVAVYSVEESEIATDAQKRETKRTAYSDASRLEGELIQFLNENRATYPLWNTKEIPNQKRTAYNFYRV